MLSASETKEKRADERPVDELLTPAIEGLPRSTQTGAGAVLERRFSPVALLAQ